jgi:hypothetical protein
LAVFGSVSALFRDAPSSLGIGWGVLAGLAAVVYCVLSVVEMWPRRVQLHVRAAYRRSSGKTH